MDITQEDLKLLIKAKIENKYVKEEIFETIIQFLEEYDDTGMKDAILNNSKIISDEHFKRFIKENFKVNDFFKPEDIIGVYSIYDLYSEFDIKRAYLEMIKMENINNK